MQGHRTVIGKQNMQLSGANFERIVVILSGGEEINTELQPLYTSSGEEL